MYFCEHACVVCLLCKSAYACGGVWCVHVHVCVWWCIHVHRHVYVVSGVYEYEYMCVVLSYVYMCMWWYLVYT